MEYLTKLKETMAAATPGPLTVSNHSHGSSVRAIADVAWFGASSSYSVDGHQHIDAEQCAANAAFFAAARTDVPRLIEALEIAQSTLGLMTRSDRGNVRDVAAKTLAEINSILEGEDASQD